MNRGRIVSILLAACCGCTTKEPIRRAEPPAEVCKQAENRSGTRHSHAFTEKQLDVLRSFALSESPVLWQTVQALKAEKASRKAGIAKLCNEMRDFGRNPDADPDVVALRRACADMDASLNAIYAKLEEAYIAFKKMQATPGKKEYADMMRMALEDGIQEADSAATKYRTMSKEK